MKKLAIILILCLCLFGCSEKKPLISAKSLADEIKNSMSFESELEELDEELINEFLYINKDMYTQAYMYLDLSKASSEQIIVINAKDDKEKNKIKNNIESYINDTIAIYKDYVPEELPKLEGAKVYENGLQLTCVVSKDNANLESIIKNIYNKKIKTR